MVQASVMESNQEKKPNRKFLIAVVLACNLSSFAAGTVVVWTSPVINRLTTVDPDINPLGKVVTSTEQSLISSLMPLGAVLGPLCAGLMADRIGRKKTLLYFTGIPLTVSSIILAFSKSVILYYLGRFLSGIACGNVFVMVPIYLAEISEVSFRGIILSSMNIFLTLGDLFTYAVGPYVSIKSLNLLIAVFTVIFLLTFAFCPESPYYLITKNDPKSAQISLGKLRGSNIFAVADELKMITETVENDMKSKGSFLDIFTNKRCRKAFLICVGLFTIQQSSGISAILFYTSDLFRASGSTLDSSVSAIIIGFVQVVSAVVIPTVIDRYGRKVLLLVSGIGIFISEVPLGYYYYLKESNHDVDYINWLPIVCLIVYILTYCFGYGAIPWIIMGEIFPADIKAKASMIITSYPWFLCFVMSNFFVHLTEWLGTGVTFWIFAGCCFVGISFTHFCAIETKGKTFLEIQDSL